MHPLSYRRPHLHHLGDYDRHELMSWLMRILRQDYITRRRPVDVGNPADVALALVDICGGQLRYFFVTRWHGDAQHYARSYHTFCDLRVLYQELLGLLDSYRPCLHYFKHLREIA